MIELHRLRAWLPRLAGLLTAAVGAVNVISALSPELPGRLALLAGVVPHGAILAAHALILPAGIALTVLSVYLGRRRQRAHALAVGVLAAVGAFELLKGLDVAEALVSWSLAGALWLGRRAFTVRHAPIAWTHAAARVVVACGGLLIVTAGVVAAVTRAAHPAAGAVLRETLDLLMFSPGPLALGPHGAWVPLAAGVLSTAALATVAWLLFRPLGLPLQPAAATVQRLARRLVREHGSDTLSAFKLRPDLPRFVTADGTAFCSYRVSGGVLLVAGDPVGPPAALPGLLRELKAFAGERGLCIGAVGASEAFAGVAQDAGLRSLYLGDEALIDTGAFSLEGRPIKKVRQAVNRVSRLGYEASLHTVGDLTPEELDELDAVSERWRQGAPERGFSMVMDGLRGEHVRDSIVIVARDDSGRARGFLHFVPAYGRSVMSLSAMRRDRDTPNGVTEYLVVAAIESLRARGVDELSLNFAAFARWLDTPANRIECALARVVRLGNPFFQIESLFRFNAKFDPRWQPRFLLHQGPLSLPRTALAALLVEGQIPSPPRPRLRFSPRPSLAFS